MAKAEIRERIEARISQGEFLASMLHMVGRESDQVQTDFVDRLSALAEGVRALLEGNSLIRRLSYEPRIYWPAQKGRTYAFIDGGVASIDLPSAAPVGIRVGSYVVRPGEHDLERRERFQIELALVDDLFSETGVLFDDDFLDVAKLRDAARMISEVSAAYQIAQDQADRVDAIVLHGPLINPVAPYGLENFPAFGKATARAFLGDDSWQGSDRDRQFISLYLNVLTRLSLSSTPVVGVVERSIGRDPVFLRRLLQNLKANEVLSEEDCRSLLETIVSYGLNDSSLLDVVLSEGEYIAPALFMRQGPKNKWPEEWSSEIERYPDALTTYLKPSPLVLPFRVETFESTSNFESVLALILHTSRLLPSYGFPVGLDIVDKFAKVPAWLSRGIKGQHQVVLLKRAIQSGDPRAVAFAKRVLAAKGRDWLFRPSA